MNRHLPVGRVAAHLDALPRERAWFCVIVAIIGLVIADARFRELGLAPLFIPVVCAACWTLGARAGFFVALVAAILAVAPHLTDEAHHSLAIIAARAAVRIATYLFIAAIVVSFRRSFDRERYLAVRDRMTGALNKEAFHQQSGAFMEAAARANQTLLLAILDLDDFKTVNNIHGHAAGDAVLRTFAAGAGEIVRREDLFGRIGGDEFAFLIPVRSIEDGGQLATALHRRLSDILSQADHPVTCSMGALLLPPEALRGGDGLMHVADLAMYRAKRTGKNAVEITELDRPPASALPAQLREQVA